MNHSRVRARLNDYLERDLPPKERSRVMAHLAECPECAEELRELESTVTLLRRLPEVPVPPAFAASVIVSSRGSRHSSFKTSPGCGGLCIFMSHLSGNPRSPLPQRLFPRTER